MHGFARLCGLENSCQRLEQPYSEMLFWQFSNMTTYVRVVGKLQDWHFNVWLFSHPGDKVLILVERWGQICPIVVLLFFNIVPWLGEKQWIEMLPRYMWSCWKIAVATFDCMVVLQSRGQDLSCCWNLMTPGSHIAN